MNKKMKRNLIIAAAAVLLLAVALVVVLLLPSSDAEENTETTGTGVTEMTIDEGIDMRPQVHEDGLHDVVINTNEKGEIENNSYGTLLPDYAPANINKISMKTQGGNYTFLVETPVNADGTTEATIYTLEGFEGYDLSPTPPALIASAVCNLDFSQVADLNGKNEADYGFDSPRAEATIYYTDGTYSVIRLGDDAPGSQHCYLQFGESKTVYIVLKEDVEPLLCGFNELFNPSINIDKVTVSDDSFDKIILGGTHLDEEFVIIENTEGSLACSYLTEDNMPVNTNEASVIMGSIKTLTTDSVECVNPDAAQLEKYGLKTPFATVKTNYLAEGGYDEQGNALPSDEILFSVSLIASKADAEGMVYIMEENGKIVYKISADKVPWATTTKEKLAYEYVLMPTYFALGTMKIEAEGKSYELLLSYEQIPYTDADGNESYYFEPKAYYKGNLLDSTQFSIFYQDLMYMKVAGTDSSSSTRNAAMKITYTYNTERKEDIVELYYTDNQKIIPVVNSEKVGYVYRADITALVKNLESLMQGKEIVSVYTAESE